VRPLAHDVIGNVGEILWILLAAVGVVWLIACGNVANLFLVRAEGRHHELAMRAALGASRGRITRALLSESVALALVGGATGVALAQAATLLLQRLAPTELPRLDEIDTMVLLFTLGVSVLSGALFGLFAVLRFGSPNLTTVKEGGRGTSNAPGRHHTRNALVVGQVALALTLLLVSGLMFRTFIAMRQVEPGFTRPEEVQTFVIAIPVDLISDPRQAARTFESVSERLGRVPGVTSVGLSSSITMDGEDNGNSIEVESASVPDGQRHLLRFKSFAPGYFETMGNLLVAGRPITWSEIHEQRPVIVISATLARQLWRDPSIAIGKRVRGQQPQAPWREIVGVVGDERDDGLNQPATAIVYWPMLNESYRWRIMAYAVRSGRVGTPGFLCELERAVWSVDRNLPLANVNTLEEISGSLHGADILRAGDVEHCRERRAPYWRGWDLRRDRLRSHTANARDRCTDGTRRADRRCAEDVCPSGALSHGRRHRTGHWRRNRPDARHVGVPVRRRSGGSDYLRSHVRSFGSRSAVGDVSPSEPRRASASNGRLASGHVAQAVYLAFMIFITVIRDAPET
jgi:predicted permease